jgi:hypothetical protein
MFKMNRDSMMAGESGEGVGRGEWVGEKWVLNSKYVFLSDD